MILRPNAGAGRPARVMIAEHQRASRQALTALVTGYEGVELVGAHGDGPSVLDAMTEGPPDLLLLDVEMPGLDVTRMLEALPPGDRPALVFITANREHAVAAFEIGAVDYVIKPWDDSRVRRALARALRRLGRPDPQAGRGDRNARDRGGPWVQRLLVQRSGRSAFFLPVAEIRFMEAEQNYVRVHYDDGRDLVRSSLTDMEARLDPTQFRRVHRSFLVNLRAVERIEPRGTSDYRIVLRNGVTVPVGRAYRDRVLSDA